MLCGIRIDSIWLSLMSSRAIGLPEVPEKLVWSHSFALMYWLCRIISDGAFSHLPLIIVSSLTKRRTQYREEGMNFDRSRIGHEILACVLDDLFMCLHSCVGTTLVCIAIDTMCKEQCDEVSGTERRYRTQRSPFPEGDPS